nr:hypothetical protein [Tanacetum cinerariifolium]
MTEVKVLMALNDDENVDVGKESARNGELVKITMKKVHILLDIEDNDERKYFIDFLCIDLNYIEEQRNNLMLKHRDLIQELDTCKEHILVLKQAKLDFLTMQHVNVEILNDNQNIRKELKELTTITETWLNNSNKVNQCISEQIPTQKKRILGPDQLAEDPSSSGQKDLGFVCFFKGFTSSFTNQVCRRRAKLQVKINDPSVAITDSSATEYDSDDESLVCSTHLPSLEKLAGNIMAKGEIDNLTMEQYLTLTRGNQVPSVVKPKIRGNVNFKIKSQFMQELREDTFSKNKNDDAHEHEERVLDIVSLFNIPGVTYDAVMLQVFPIKLTRFAKGWVDRLSPRTVDFKDLFKKSFIQCHQNVNIFYNGLGTINRQLLDLQGLIPSMTLDQALTVIQPMTDHSQKRHDGSSSRNIDSSSSNSKGIASIVRERRPSLTEIINKYIEEAAKRHAEQDEWLKKFYQKTKTNREAHNKIIQGLETKVTTLTNKVEGRTNGGKFEECKAILTEDGSPLYTLFYYSLEEIKYLLAHLGFFDNERQENDKSGMKEALAALEITHEIKEVTEEEKQVQAIMLSLTSHQSHFLND